MQEFGFDDNDVQDDQWISAADLLGAALIVFLLLMLYFILTDREQSRQFSEQYTETVSRLETQLQNVKQTAQLTPDSVREVAVIYDQKRAEILKSLKQEFAGDLPRWNAEIEDDLTVRFNEPNVLFAVGSANIRDRFKGILQDFFPRYLATINQGDFRDSVAEVRIEGYTSSFWNRQRQTPVQEAFLKNMDLSYNRSRNVLHYVMALSSTQSDLPWLRKHLTANGFSSSDLILNPDGTENYARSQRVEFRIRTDLQSRMAKILEEKQ